MRDEDKTKQELIKELHQARAKIQSLQTQLEDCDAYSNQLFQNAVDAVYVHDLQGNFLDANPAALNLFGYSKKEIKKIKFEDLLDAEEVSKAYGNIEFLLKEKKKTRLFPYRVKAKDGSYRFIETTAFLTCRQGKPHSIIGIGRDITQRIELENQLKKRERLFSQMFESHPSVKLLIDPTEDGKIVDANQAASEFYGYPIETLKQMLISEVNTLPKDDIQRELNLAVEQRKNHFHFKHRLKSGDIREVEVYSSRIDIENKPMLYSVIHDINHQKTVENRLKRSYKIAKLGHWDWCMSTQELIWSDEVYDIFGRDKNSFEVNVDSFEACIHPEDYHDFVMERENALRENRDVSIEHRIILPDNSIRYVHEIAEIIRNEKGEVIQVLGTVQDITERKQMETQIKENQQRLNYLSNCIPGAIYQYQIDSQGQQSVPFMSKSAVDLFEQSIEELMDRDQLFLNIHPEDIQGFMDSIKYSKQNLTPWDREFRIITPEGTIKWLKGHSIPEKRRDGSYLWNGILIDVTDRKLMEEKLIQSEYALSMAQELANLGSFYWDIKANTLTWSKNMYKLAGIDAEHFSGDLSNTIEQLIHPEDRKWVKEEINQMIIQKKTWPIVYRFLRPDGVVLSIKADAVFLFDENNELDKCIGIHYDLTKLQDLQKDVSALERELQLTLDATTEGIWKWNFKTDELFFSPQYYKMLGYEPDEFSASFENWRNLIHPDDLERALKVAEEYLNTKPDHYENEFRLRTKSGDYKWVMAKAKVVERDHQGVAIRMIGNHIDITEIKKKEADLRESEERYRAIFENSPDAIFIADPQTGTIVDLNKTAEVMYQCSRKDLLGIHQSKLHPKEMKSNAIKLFEQHTKLTTEKETLETVALRSDGAHIPVEVVGNKITLQGKNYLMGIFRDITERKKAEEELIEAQSRFRDLFLNAQVGLFRTDIKTGLMLEANDALARFAGYNNREELLADHYIIAEHYLHLEDRKAMIAEIMEKGEIRNYEAPFVRMDGSIIWIRFSARITKDKKCIEGVSEDFTAERKAKDALRDSEKRFRDLTDLLPEAVIETDRYFNITYANNQAFQLMGYNKEDLNRGLSALEMILQEDRKRVQENVKRRMAGEDLGAVEYLGIKSTGETIPVLMHGDPIVKNGEFAGLRVIIIDITEHKKAELALKASEEKYRLLIQRISSAIVVHDAQTRIVASNPKAQELLGLSENQMMGKKAIDPEWCFINSNRDPLPFELYPVNQVLATQQPLKDFVLGIHRSSKQDLVWVLVNAVPVFDDSHTIQEVIISFVDITARKSVEEKLRDSEEKYRALFENAPVGILSLNLSGEIIDINQRLIDILGSPSIEATKQINIFTFKNLVDAGISDKVKQCIKTGETIFDNAQYISFWGKQLHLEYIIKPIFDSSGQISYCQAIVEDITERKVTEERIKEALEKATRSDKLKSAFLANMSHEIRTPLNAILGFVDLLIDDPDCTPEIKENLYIIKESGRHLLELISDILELSKIESGEMVLINKPFSLYEELSLLQYSSNIIIMQKKKDIKLYFHYDKSIQDIILGDPIRLRQVLNNLLSNAIKFTDQGSITIKVERIGEDYLEFSVADTGIGIENAKIQEIFKPFVQEEYNTGEKYGGTGLGLSISKRLVELMDGEIRVDSKKGEGSRFRIILPYLPSTQTEEEEQPSIKPAKSGQKYLILLAEDDKANQIIMTKFLINYGFDYLLAADGLDAVSQYHSYPTIDLILMDIRMPSLDGIQAAIRIREIQANEKRKPIPIIALTAAVMPEDIEKAKQAEFDDYIKKPFDKEELLRSIKKYLNTNG